MTGLTLTEKIITISVFLFAAAALFFCMPASAADICTVEVTSPATVGIITLSDADGSTIATETFMPAGNNAGEPVLLTYDKSKYSLASVSIIPAGYYGVTAPAQNPKGDTLRVVFHLSQTDETAGYADVTDLSAVDDGTASASPLPAYLILAGLVTALILNKHYHQKK